MLNRLRRRSWRFLHFASGLQDGLQRRLTNSGQVILAATLAGALFGVDTHKTLGAQLFGLGFGLLLLGIIGSWRRPKGLVARRYLPRYATIGVPLHYRVLLENQATKLAAGLVIQERLPDPRPDLETFLHTPAPWEHRVNFLDRMVGYPRWHWLVRQGQRADPPSSVAIPPLAAGARATVDLTLLPRRRGPLLLNKLEAMRSDPLGLGWRRSVIATRDRLLVLPRRYPIPPQRPPGRRRVQPGGLGLAAAKGDSQEFIGLRAYRPGDSLRHIHWAAWARSGSPVVKEYQDEYFSRQALILDSFVSPGYEEDFEAAVSIAASCVEPLQTSDTILDLMFVADQAYTLTSGRGLLSSEALLEVLACVTPQHGDFTVLSRAVLNHTPLLSACLCVLMAWDAPRHDLVTKLLALNIPLRVLVVGGPTILEPGPMAAHLQNLHRLDPKQLAAELANLV